MAAQNGTLKNNGNDVYPKTLEMNVYDGNGNRLDQKLAQMSSDLAFFHQQTKVCITDGYASERVKYYAQQITFEQGVNIVEVRDDQNRTRGSFFVSAQSNLYYAGIYVGYYTDYVYRVMCSNGTFTVKQLAEVS